MALVLTAAPGAETLCEFSSASSVSCDSVVCDAGPDAPATATKPAVAGERGAAAKSPRGMDDRPIGVAYNTRNDVGMVGILSGNWGGPRSDQVLRKSMDNDLKAGVASLLFLQEAHAELVPLLQQRPDKPKMAFTSAEPVAICQEFTVILCQEQCHSLLCRGGEHCRGTHPDRVPENPGRHLHSQK